jgi:hypothetical protein
VRLRPLAATVLAVLAACALLFSAFKDVPHSWRLLRSQHAAYAALPRADKDRLFGTSIPMPMDIIDFWKSGVRPWDRYWIQMPHEAFSSYGDKRQIAELVTHLYFLPAIEARTLADATVVLSWDADPATLHLRFWDQRRAGQQLIYWSRVARDD